jgi:PPM family protein phosphatase
VSPRLVVGGRSDVGMHRQNNEDSMYAGPHLIAVADGVGGAVGGEIASSLTITALAPLDTPAVTDPDTALRDAATQADEAIRDTAAHNAELTGMSTTLTAILATSDRLTLAHIGDSRAYRLRGGVLTQISDDHTLVRSLVDDGQITEEEALVHPRRSWILRALDGRGNPELDVVELDLAEGDRLLVCSDGVSDYVAAADIETALGAADPQAAADRLVDLALAAGGPDNITCVVADAMEDLPAGGVDAPAFLGGAIAEGVLDGLPTGPGHTTAPPTHHHRTPRHRSVEPADHNRSTGRSIGKRLAVVTGIVLILVAAAVAGVAVYVHHQWYVSTSGGDVAIYRGVSGSVAGHQLSRVHTVTNIPVTALPQDDQANVTSGIKKSSQSAAEDVVNNLRAEACADVTPSPPTPSPTPTSTTVPSPTASHATAHHHHPSATPTPSAPTPAWCEGTP